MTTAQPEPAMLPRDASRPLLEVRDLAVSFDAPGGRVQAVQGVNLTIHPRQTLAVVGESGCGKSVTAMTTLQLVPRPPGRIDRGSIVFDGRDLLTLSEKQMLAVRGREIAMIFQEPMTSLNPVYSIGEQIIEAVMLHQHVARRQAREIAAGAMAEVGISRPLERLKAYPHEFSGGMRQRVMTAMALACRPRLLLADEPTTSLDVTIQAQILELLRTIQREREMAIMLITHDLGVVAENADVVCVMYAGRVVEYARALDLFDKPHHPYTRGLFNSIPKLRERRHRLTTVAEVINNPNEFRRLPGHELGLVPWWPRTPETELRGTLFSVHLSPQGDETVLYEIEPEHWVCCWRTDYLAHHPESRPDIPPIREGASDGTR